MESSMGKSSKEFKNVDTSLTILTTPINKNRGELNGLWPLGFIRYGV